MVDFGDERTVAKPLTEALTFNILEKWENVIQEVQTYKKYDLAGVHYHESNVISRLYTFYYVAGAMIKRSNDDLYDKLKAALNNGSQIDSLTDLMFEIAIFLDEKNITKVDMRTARSKRGIEKANEYRSYT